MVEIRKMQPQEANEVRQIATKAFSGIERFLIGKPKEAMVAIVEGEIVGGIIIKYIQRGNQKIGYYDGAFIHPSHHGKGIGSELYAATNAYLWEQDCTAQAALVKDDNVGSWKLFLNNGFSQVSFFEGVRTLGLGTMMQYYFSTPFFASIGMEFYLQVKDKALETKSKSTFKNLFLYLFINVLLVLLGFVGSSKDYPMYLGAFLTVLASGALFAYIGTLFSKRNWYFRLNSGGAFLCGILSLLGSILPMIGTWYPKKYEDTKAFRRDLGILTLFEWSALIVLTAITGFLVESNIYVKYVNSLGVLLLIYKSIPVYPFESYGSGRIYKWNKWLYAVLVAASVLVILGTISIGK